MPQTCEQCAEWGATGTHDWNPAQRCRPQCYYSRFGEWALQMRRAWHAVAQCEDFGDKGKQWSVDWATAQYQLSARHPAFVGDAAEPWEVGEALRTIAGWKNETSRGDGGNLLLQLGRPMAEFQDDDPDGDEAA